MQTTLDLLARAVLGAPSERQLSIDLGLAPTALCTARQRGNLSPAVAGAIAARLGENVGAWMARAAIEAASKHPRTAAARRSLRKVGAQVTSFAQAVIRPFACETRHPLGRRHIGALRWLLARP